MKEMSEQYLEALRNGNHAEKATAFIVDNASVEGSHHKTWVIDQVLRMISGERYTTVTAVYQDLTGFDWDMGIAP